MTTFKDLGLNAKIMASLDDLGFTEPSPIQAKAVPFLLKSKKDLTALAQTGTGKTAAYSLPILNQIKTGAKDLQAIILCPTRELCLQISQDIKKFSKHSTGVETIAVYGGERIDLQIRALKRGVNIVVGTPGRVHDLIRRKILKLQSIKWLVLDEADEMLDMGFKDDLDAILEQTPETRQTLLFSATMSRSVQSIAKRYMKETEEISIGEKNIGAENVSHEYYVVQAKDRFEALKRILDSLPGVYGILFCRTRHETQTVADKLKQADYDTEALHGEVSQNIRTKIMDRFKKKQVRLLVATDVAARGIDVNNLSHVINYNLPDQDESYTHRSGRTGRAQKSGISISIINSREIGRIRRIENILGRKIEYKKIPDKKEVCQRQIDNFVKEIESADVKNIAGEKYFLEIAEKLKHLKKDDLINYFISNKLSHLMGACGSDYDLNANTSEPRGRKIISDEVNLKINFGKKDGLNIKEFFALINSSRNLKGLDIGQISLMPEHSIFSVEKRRADEVIASLSGINFKGRKMVVNRTDDAAGGFAGKRSAKPTRGFKARRRKPGRSRY